MIYIAPEILERVNQWLVPFFDKHTQQTVKELIANDPKGLEDAFYKNLAFGTGGMRGVMGVGDNRINKYTLGKNTQGLSNYLKEVFPGESLQVAIAYDCRHNSKSLAQEVAAVFAANNIKVFLFSDLRPTPELSFAVRQLGCHCGIVLTASHNPPEYNGYKVYWQDGGQLVPPQDQAIINHINALEYTQIKSDPESELIQLIDQVVDEQFIAACIANGSKGATTDQKAALNIVFTALHGTSITMIPPVLSQSGYTNLNIVEEQSQPNGDFPTVKSPNPEEPDALAMAMKQAQDNYGDIVIGTDPDCDRLGIAIRNEHGKMQILNGNQAMVLKTHYLLDQKVKTGGIQSNDFIASTIVSTPMMEVLAKDFGLECKVGLTGFKWIAKMVKDFPELNLIGGGEESYGFMVGDFVRDKDAVTATLLACEIAAQQKAKGATLLDYLIELYKKYGVYQEELISFVKPGKEGAQEIEAMMVKLREQPVAQIDGANVVRVEDYQSSKVTFGDGTAQDLDIPKSNVLIFYTQDGSKIAARPSGTEPKIKFYISVNQALETDYRTTQEALLAKIDRIATEFNLR